MAVTLSTFGNYEVGTTPVENGGFVVIDTSGGAQATTLPASAPQGFHFWVVRSGANNVTLAAASGDTVTGATTLGTDGAKSHLMKRTATNWGSYEDATFS